MTLADYCRMRLPGSRWKRGARRVIVAVIEASGEVSPSALLAAVDHAYPFGQRKYEPYKCWLAERKLFREALAGDVDLPSQDEIDACEVARDMVIEGRLDDARRALDLAPHRLTRPCPACGRPAGEECTDVLRWEIGSPRPRLPVPHHARLVGHLDAGPLFGADR